MAMIKTAISMPKSMFDEVSEAAHEMEVSRSRVIVLALKDFLRQRDADRMLAQLNAVYGEEEDPEEQGFLDRMFHVQAQAIEGEW